MNRLQTLPSTCEQTPKKEKKTVKTQNPKSVRNSVNKIRKGVDKNGQKLKAFEIKQQISERITTDLQENGCFYCDGEVAYYLDRVTRRFIDLGQGGTDLNCVLRRYGLNPTENEFAYVAAEMYQHAIEIGERSSAHNFAHLELPDQGQSVLYISAEENMVWRITKDSRTLEENGINGVLFVSSAYCAPKDLPVWNEANGSLIDEYITDRIPFDTSKLTMDEYRILIRSHCLILFMREIIQDTRPIFAFIGEKGSAKSTAASMIGKTIYGPEWAVFDVANDVRDFDAMVTSEHYVCLDNADDNVKWLNSKLSVVASGGKIPRRVLYVTNQFAAYPIVSMLSTTSRTPCFRRDDVAERLVIFNTVRVDSSNQNDFDADVLDTTLSKRKEIWAELISNCQATLRVLDESDWRSIKLKGARMQGFARFTEIVSRAIWGQPLAAGTWSKLISMQKDFVNQSEIVIALLTEWVPENPGREVTAGKLFADLDTLVRTNRIVWSIKSGQALGQKLSKLESDLKDLFDYESSTCPKRNQRVYKFFPKGQRNKFESPADSGEVSGSSNPHQ